MTDERRPRPPRIEAGGAGAVFGASGPGGSADPDPVGQDAPVPTVIIRSLPARLGTVCVVGAVALLTAWSLLSDGAAALPAPLGWGGLLCLAVWALWWAPQITLSQDRLIVRNAWRTHAIDWSAVVGCRTRWSLVLVLRSGAQVRAAAAQRAGGLAQSLDRYRQLREREALSGSAGAAVAQALAHRGVRDEFLDPGEGTYRTGLDADGAGHLVEAYRDRRAVLVKVVERDRRRARRLERSRGGSASREGDARAGRGDDQEVVSRLNPAPVIAASLLTAIALASLM